MDNTLEKAIVQVMIDKCKNNWDMEQPITRKDLLEIIQKAIEIRDNK